jgi:hypothetical protein
MKDKGCEPDVDICVSKERTLHKLPHFEAQTCCIYGICWICKVGFDQHSSTVDNVRWAQTCNEVVYISMYITVHTLNYEQNITNISIYPRF